VTARDLQLMVTLWPSFPHFPQFAADPRLRGIRLNSAMMAATELEKELELASAPGVGVPLWFDVKGRQMRVAEVIPDDDHLEVRLNHPIRVRTPVPVLFKAGADSALLLRVEEGGRKLVFQGGPHYQVRAGESLHIRHPSLEIRGPLFTDAELAKIAMVRQAGCRKWFLSYVEEARDIDRFLELVGRDAEVMLKIESPRGLAFVADDFVKRENLTLVAARGDLYVELERPHEILKATKLIVERDPEACVGSRILLSTIQSGVPECADFSELAWLYDIGYRTMMLCDEICLKEKLLARAVNAFDAFRQEYA
jgi:hypothetical protein